MRGYKGSKSTFAYPDVEDIIEVTAENIVKKLQIIHEKRGKYMFKHIVTIKLRLIIVILIVKIC